MYKQLELFPEEEPKEDSPKVDLNPLFDRLAKSKFRSSFYLNAKDKEYIREKGWEKIEQGAREIIAKRIAPAYIPNDGKQTPMRMGFFHHSSLSTPPAAVAVAACRSGTG